MIETDRTGRRVVVEDLDAASVLTVLADKETAGRVAERGKLRLAVQWCVLHPATADTGVATWGDDHLPGILGTDESLGGDGTPAIAAFTPEPFAAALEVSTLSGMALIAAGQTCPENLAPLCRRHHRAKTAGRWRYQRLPDGAYLWHGPHHRSYLVTGEQVRELRWPTEP